jgi:apolipoprotein N-acyltransferase
MKNALGPIACAGLSGVAFFLSTGFGELWWLAWFAPVPVLALAFSKSNPMIVIAVAIAAMAIGASSALLPYLGLVPLQTIGAALALEGIAFAICAMAARFTSRTLFPLAGPLCFAALWTAWDYLASLGPDGAIFSPAYSQAGFPILIQSASVLGMWGVTFLVGLMAALTALAFAERNATPVLLAAGMFVLNLTVGAIRMEFAESETTRVVMIDSDILADASDIDREDLAMGAITAYAGESRLMAQHAALIVLPEKIAVVRPKWKDAAQSEFQHVADATGATIVGGFNVYGPAERESQTWVFQPNVPMTMYSERTPGPAFGAEADLAYAGATDGDTLIEASSHMSYQALLRGDALRTHAPLVAVPAWDFGIDTDLQSRVAILRSVENGFALARNARYGAMMLSDPNGRVAAMEKTGGNGFSTLAAGVRTGAGSGYTLYDVIGDAFAWVCACFAAAMLLTAFVRMLMGKSAWRDLRARPFGGVLKPVWTARASTPPPARSASSEAFRRSGSSDT